MKKIPLRVLIVEDSEFDARILANVLRQGGYQPDYVRVETAEAFREALNDKSFEIVLSDYILPEFSAPSALNILQESGRDLPFIIISGGIGEDTAVSAMKAGAHDYLMKGQLARLAPAVERELREAKVRKARKKTELELRDSELRYRMLWENSTDAVLMMDEKSTICFANPAVSKVFGYKPSDLVGKNLAILLPEKGDFAEWLDTGGEPVRREAHETIGLRKDETPVTIEIAFNDMKLKGKRWYVAFIRDITARKKAEKELREHQEEFRIAREIQQNLFPEKAPSIRAFDIAGVSYPARDTGGDYFDYLKMVDGSLGLVVADVTGKGVGPAMLMAEARAFLRILANNRDDLGQILTRANRALAQDLDFERFITVLLVKVDHVQKNLTYVNAGHPKGLIFAPDGTVRKTLIRTGPPLGIQPEAPYQAAQPEPLSPGEIVCLMTDGFEEAMSPEEDFFGEERICRVIQQNRSQSAQAIIDALHRAVTGFTQDSPQQDDLTLIVLKVL